MSIPKVQSIEIDNSIRTVIVYPRGDRYEHDHKFKLSEKYNAEYFRKRVANHLAKGNEVNFAYWHEIAPEPGTVAGELFLFPEDKLQDNQE